MLSGWRQLARAATVLAHIATGVAVSLFKGLKMRLIEPGERKDFLAALRHNSLGEGEFELRETDTTDPKGDENFGLQGYVTVTRRSTHVTREYPIGYEADWVQHFRQDLEAGVFDKPE
jgi:hypothetical protein